MISAVELDAAVTVEPPRDNGDEVMSFVELAVLMIFSLRRTLIEVKSRRIGSM